MRLLIDLDGVAADFYGSLLRIYNKEFNNSLTCEDLVSWELSPDIFIGANVVDFSGYPDCRPEYLKAFEKMANLAVREKAGKRIRIHSPLIKMAKADIIKKGLKLGVDYSLTHTCYDPAERGISCGECDACILRKKGFKEAQTVDPVRYKK